MGQLVEVQIPKFENEGTDAVLETWLHKVGDSIKKNQPLLEITTDKVTLEVPAPVSGILQEILCQAGEGVAEGRVVAKIALVTPEASDVTKTEAKESVQRSSPPQGFLSPAVRRLLKQHQIDPVQILGSGVDGRITHDDVQAYIEQQLVNPPKVLRTTQVPHSPMRRKIAEQMVRSAFTAPHVTAVFEADFSAIIDHRRRFKEEFAKQGVRLTLTSYFVAALVKAIKTVPQINSRWHDDYLEIAETCNIGVATALERRSSVRDGVPVRKGLVVPVIHHAEDLDLMQIAEKLQELTETARSGNIRRKHITGGTITITNHGVSGSLIATPIINQPEVAILGIGKVQKKLVFDDLNAQEPVTRAMAYVTLTIDHRVLDGLDTNLCLSEFVHAIEGWGASD